MDNNKSLIFFSKLAQGNTSKKDVKINKFNDHTDIDAEFILKYSNHDTTILDLASGSGLIINKIYKKVKHITAVEKFTEFSKFIIKSDAITIINEDISKLKIKNKYDLITMFGIVQYFNTLEIRDIYKKYLKNLNIGGKLIIKNQFGLNKDIIIDGYSEELKTNYYSEYRFIKNEINILLELGITKVEKYDIYPNEFNRWNNTHFYALVAST